MKNKVEAPWTDEQVRRLNDFQNSGAFHPFTCPEQREVSHNKGEAHKDTDLIATNDGWVCPECDYTQNWAHKGMLETDWSEFNAFK